MTKYHLSIFAGDVRCGVQHRAGLLVTKDPKKVTCKRCRQRFTVKELIALEVS